MPLLLCFNFSPSNRYTFVEQGMAGCKKKVREVEFYDSSMAGFTVLRLPVELCRL